MNIAVTNRKGGVGKSTMSLHLATGLATLGYRVALVDTDSQGHVSLSLDLPRTDGLYRALVEDATINDVVIEVEKESYSPADNLAKGQLYVIPAEDKTYQIASHIEQQPFKFLNFTDDLKHDLNLHFVIIDTSPTIKDLDSQIFMATDGYLYVSEAERLSRHGIEKAIKQMSALVNDRIRHLRRPTTVLGILPNKVRNTDSHIYNLEEMETEYGKYLLNPIRLRTAWSEASVYAETLFTYAPTSDAAKEAWGMVQSVIEAVNAWHQTK
jgi:chromosome partitioning protein